MASIYEYKAMDGLSAEDQAKKAIGYLMRRIRADDRLYHLIGLGSQSFDLLTEAYATLTNTDLATLRKQASQSEPEKAEGGEA